VLLLSGDQHWNAVFRYELNGYTTYEFMPTPVGVGNRGTSVVIGGDVLYVDASSRGFGHFEVDSTIDPAELTYSWITEDGAILYTETFTEDDIGF
jgi:hypothetical protein